MKTSRTVTTILLGVVLFFPALATAGEWEWQLPLPQANTLASVDWADGATAMAVGGNATILLTHDGGASWTVEHFVAGDASLSDVCFIDVNTAACVGPGGVIIRTNDGGATWTTQESGITTSLNAVDFVDPDTGYAVGHYGVILKTTDGGVHWTPQASSSSDHLIDVSFSDAVTGTVVGSDGVILRTTDGGVQWTPQAGGTAKTLLGVCFADADTGMVVGGNETALLTTDGGASWTTQVFPPRPSGDLFVLRDVCMIDGRHAWIAGYFQDAGGFDIGYVLQTADGGSNWDRVYSDDGGYNFLNAVSFSDTQNGVAVGDFGTIHRTTDGGGTWTKVGGASTDLLMDGVDFFDADHGVAVSWSPLLGGIGEVYYTSDGGNDWSSVRASDVFGPLKFYDVTYATEDTVWAVGVGYDFWSNYGTLYRSTDGGVSYDVYALQTCYPWDCSLEHHLKAISFAGADDGVAVGDWGVVWTIQNGAVTKGTSGFTRHLRDVSMPDASTAIAVGDSGTVMVSANAGASWTPKDSGVIDHLQSVSFPTSQTGTAVGDAGTIIRTTDGGESWLRQESGTTASLQAVDFLDELTGAAAGGSVVLVTLDGGETWTVDPPGVTGGLRDIALAPGKMVAVGAGQTILNRKGSLVGIDARQPAIALRLDQNRPNPFNPVTTIDYDLPVGTHVELTVYNALGQYVATLVDEPQSPGRKTVRWYGIDDGGSRVASGVYFYRLRAGNAVEARKMVVVK